MNDRRQNLDAILDRQKKAWLEGSRPAIDLLLRDSSLPNDSEILLDLIYNEIFLREELGECPAPADYVQRYPHLQKELDVHFEIHHALRENLLVETNRVHNPSSIAEDDSISWELGPKLTNYQILCELGRGGMGVVYKARHHRLKRLVALKMFQPGRLPSPRELARFCSEAETVARLQHPNIVQIFEVGQENGMPFLALELAEDGTLAQKLQELPFTPRASAQLLDTLAGAIHHAHEQHIIHRDLKPANVLFAGNGTPKITDFGLAKTLVEDADSPCDPTRSGEPIGTPRYMAPEQAAGQARQIGPATDVYALGNLLYECLTGQVPFVSASVVETMEKIRWDEPRSPRRLQPSIPRDLETICLKCLHKQPDRRYDSALALSEDLRRFLKGEPILARPTPAWERVALWSRRRPMLATLIGIGFILVVTGVIFFFVREHMERQRLAMVRAEVAALVKEGQEALDRQDERTAREKFLAALATIKGEPALEDHELGVAGWLDHTLRQAEQNRWRTRRPPTPFDELRDEAFLLSVLFQPKDAESVRTARDALQNALSLTVADDPAWRREREQLVLLDVDLILREGDAASALALLEREKGTASRLWHQRLAECLERLNRKPEAEQERRLAEQSPPSDAFGFFLHAVDHYRQQDPAGAIRDLDKVLEREPDHFTARLFQAFCFLDLKRPEEAKVALTACIGQRPLFVWSYLFRGLASLQLKEYSAAARDFQRVHEMSLHDRADERMAERVALQERRLYQAVTSLQKAITTLPQKDQEKFWQQVVVTEQGAQSLRELPLFKDRK